MFHFHLSVVFSNPAYAAFFMITAKVKVLNVDLAIYSRNIVSLLTNDVYF